MREERPPGGGASHVSAVTGGNSTGPSHRSMLAALAVCCAVPMLAVLVLTSVVGLAIGPAAAITLGSVAAVVCVVVMARSHGRAGGHHDE